MPIPEHPTTRDKLFMAGIKIFAQKGYSGATVRANCQEAGAANATAINYYFGGKEKTYMTILDMIFAENLKRRQELRAQQNGLVVSPEEQLRNYLRITVEVIFSGGPLADDITAILLRELVSPSAHLDALVDSYTRMDDEELKGIVRDILGPDMPEYLVRDSMVSVAGQLFYYLAFWPIFSRVNPDHPGISNYKEPLVDHVMRFSMAGLEAIRTAWRKGELPARQHE